MGPETLENVFERRATQEDVGGGSNWRTLRLDGFRNSELAEQNALPARVDCQLPGAELHRDLLYAGRYQFVWYAAS
jgi:hypothetical protein